MQVEVSWGRGKAPTIVDKDEGLTKVVMASFRKHQFEYYELRFIAEDMKYHYQLIKISYMSVK